MDRAIIHLIASLFHCQKLLLVRFFVTSTGRALTSMAVIFFIPTILLEKRYPNIYAGIFAAFAVILGVYIWLMFSGPAFETAGGRMVQVTGQKVIAYAAIITIFFQAYGGRKIVSATEQVPARLGRPASSGA